MQENETAPYLDRLPALLPYYNEGSAPSSAGNKGVGSVAAAPWWQSFALIRQADRFPRRCGLLLSLPASPHFVLLTTLQSGRRRQRTHSRLNRFLSNLYSVRHSQKRNCFCRPIFCKSDDLSPLRVLKPYPPCAGLHAPSADRLPRLRLNCNGAPCYLSTRTDFQPLVRFYLAWLNECVILSFSHLVYPSVHIDGLFTNWKSHRTGAETFSA